MNQTMRTNRTAEIGKSADWREKILDDHRALDQAVAAIRRSIERPRPEIGQPGAHAWASELSQGLVDLHDQLCRHFRYEEQSGMMEDLMASHPRASGQVDTLVEEHVAMLAESRGVIAALLSYSEDQAELGIGLRRRMTAMLDRLEEHERRENSLVMDLAFSDLGLGD